MPKRFIVVGLDGADWKIINFLMKKGKLPALKNIKESNSFGKLKSTIPTSSPPAWTSFLTGNGPGKHGVYDFLKITKEYKKDLTTSKDRKCPCVWNYMEDKKVISINVPLTYPPEKLNGIMISGLPAPENNSNYCYPKEIHEELKKNLNSFKIQPEIYYSENNEEAFIKDQYRCWDNTEKIFYYLKENKEWDLIICVFHVLDELSHELWGYIDKKHPKYKKNEFGKYLFKFYEKADSFISKIIDEMDEDTTLFVLSDHGFGPVYKTTYINNWLIKKGFLELKKERKTKIKKILHNSGFTQYNVLSLLRKMRLNPLNISYKKTFTSESKSILESIAKKLFLSTDDIDLKKSKVFSLGEFGQFYFKKENIGDYDKFTEKIKKELKEIKKPSGESMFDCIYTKKELYGKCKDELAPDMVFFDKKMNYLPVKMFEFGSQKLITPQAVGRTGGHKINGIFFACGKSIKNSQLRERNITDIMPTILYLLNEGIPEKIDGNIMKEIIQEDYLRENQIKHKKIKNPLTKKDKDKEDIDKEKIKERLRGLGYI